MFASLNVAFATNSPCEQKKKKKKTVPSHNKLHSQLLYGSKFGENEVLRYEAVGPMYRYMIAMPLRRFRECGWKVSVSPLLSSSLFILPHHDAALRRILPLPLTFHLASSHP